MTKEFGFRVQDVLGPNSEQSHAHNLVYGDFMGARGARPAYQHISDRTALEQKLVQLLNECNEEQEGMKLVMFREATLHLSRIVRALR